VIAEVQKIVEGPYLVHSLSIDVVKPIAHGWQLDPASIYGIVGCTTAFLKSEPTVKTYCETYGSGGSITSEALDKFVNLIPSDQFFWDDSDLEIPEGVPEYSRHARQLAVLHHLRDRHPKIKEMLQAMTLLVDKDPDAAVASWMSPWVRARQMVFGYAFLGRGGFDKIP
jgi:hypothetical protein